MLVSITQKLSVSSFIGYLKGKSNIMMFKRNANSNIYIETENFGVKDIMWIQLKETKR